MLRATKCRDCDADIIFIQSIKSGKYIPCDVERVSYIESDRGNDRLVDADGNVFSCFTADINADISDGTAHRPHWASCPGTQRRNAKRADTKSRAENKKILGKEQLSLFS